MCSSDLAIVTVVEPLESTAQRLSDSWTDRVHFFGTVDRDDRDPVAGFVADSIVGQSTVLLA